MKITAYKSGEGKMKLKSSKAFSLPGVKFKNK